MPNDTSTILTITGPLNDILKFQTDCHGESNLDFEKLYDIPPGENCYYWPIKHWGTKWNAYNVGEWDNNSIFYFTAWSPATNFYIYVSKIYKSLTFTHEYSDEGGSFIGNQTINNGEILNEENLEWHSEESVILRKKLGCYYESED